jgi:enamine deaminase RidA (YjgF/YER057c/UK114 family)
VNNEVVGVPDVHEGSAIQFVVPSPGTECVRAGDWLFLSGQAGVKRDGTVISPHFDRQVEQAFQNIHTALDAGGASFDNLVTIRVYLDDMGHLERYQSIRETTLEGVEVAETVVGCGFASPELHVIIEARAATS